MTNFLKERWRGYRQKAAERAGARQKAVVERRKREKETEQHQGELLQAVGASDFKTARSLIERYPALVSVTDDEGFAVVHQAVLARDAEFLAFVLSSGGDPNDKIRLGGVEGWTPLHCAASHGLIEAIDPLAKHGADVNQSTPNVFAMTPLHLAAACGQMNAVRRLLDLGADPNRRSGDGSTARDYAESEGHSRIAQLL